MPKYNIETAWKAKKQYLSAYGNIIKTIIALLKENRIDFVNINYDILAPRCYNVNNTSGEYDCNLIVKISLDKETSTLNVYDENNNEYNVGHDENGQDSYTLVNPEMLLSNVIGFVNAFQDRLLVLKKADKPSIVKAIHNYIGKNGNFPFEHGFQRPSLKNGETVVQITAKEVNTISPGKESSWYWLKELSVKDLKTLVSAINDYMIYLHNNA